jgi:hypothetical protein
VPMPLGIERPTTKRQGSRAAGLVPDSQALSDELAERMFCHPIDRSGEWARGQGELNRIICQHDAIIFYKFPCPQYP